MLFKCYIYIYIYCRSEDISCGWYVLTEVKEAFLNDVWSVGGTRGEAVTLQPGKKNKNKIKKL